MNSLQFNRLKIFDYFILVARFLLGIVFISYGYSKIMDNQFGLTDEMLQKPIKDLNLMQIGLYVFKQTRTNIINFLRRIWVINLVIFVD